MATEGSGCSNLHKMSEPVPVRIFKLLDKTSGRDRVCRVIQYGSKFTAWLLEQEGVSVELILKAKTLESSISTARKLFRLGKGFDNLRIALQTIHLRDPAHRVLITTSKLCGFFFLLFDHMVWAGRLKLFGINPERWNKHSTRFWLLSIMLNILRDWYDLFRAVRVEQSRLKHDGTGAKKTLTTALYRTVQNNPALVLDTVKNSTDIVLPLAQLDMGRGISSGWVGFMGVVSSICTLVAIWNESLKLRYS